MDIIRIILSVLLPPLGAFLKVGLGPHFWINTILTLFGYVPGLVHVIWLLVKK
ncbi:MAG: YqaE/Pmp3 family membrane protein [Desulfovibrionaceae bacterium]